MSADSTKELRLGTAIFFSDMPAGKASLRRVARVNVLDLHAVQSGFVTDEQPQLVECPIVLSGSFFLALNPRPAMYPLEVFKADRSPRAFGLLNESLRDAVVDISLEAALFAGKVFEVTFGRLRAALLQSSAQLRVFVAIDFYFQTAEHLTITVNRDIGSAQVNPKGGVGFLFGWVRNVAHRQQVESIFRLTIDQIAFALAVGQHFTLALTAQIRNVQPPTNRPYRHALIIGVPRQDTVIISNRPVWTEVALRFAVFLVGVGHFCEQTYNYLSRQTRLLAQSVVQRLMQRETAKHLVFPGVDADLVTHGVRLFQRLQKVLPLFGRRLKSDLSNQFHAPGIAQTIVYFKALNLNLLVFFNVLSDSFGADMACCADVVALSPQRSVLAPILLLERSKFLFQFARGYTFEQTNNLSGRTLGWRGNKQVDVIGHYFQRQHFKSVLVSYRIQKLLEAFSNLPLQDGFSVTWNPDKVVVDRVDRVWCSAYSIRLSSIVGIVA